MRKYILIAFISLLSVASFGATDFPRLREQLRERALMGPTDYDPEQPQIHEFLTQLYDSAAFYYQTMRTDTNYLWDCLSLLTGSQKYTSFHMRKSYYRLSVMSQAWGYPGNPYYHDAKLLADIRYGLDLLHRRALNENTPMITSWWEWRIGAPRDYILIVSILYEQLTPEEIHQFDVGASQFVRGFLQSGNLTFANQASLCRNLFMIGVLTDNEEDIRLALEKAPQAFCDPTTPYQRTAANAAHDRIIRNQSMYQHNTLVWKKEGLYEDGTFIQHIALPYIGTYGMEMILLLADMVNVLEGSDFEIPQSIIDVLPTWILKTYIPAIHNGELLWMYMGRATNTNQCKAARLCLLNMYDCSRLIEDATTRNKIQNTCVDIYRHARQYSSPYDALSPTPLYIPRIDAMLSHPTPSNMQRETFSIVQAAGDRLIHQRPTWRFGLSMSSNRIGKYEARISPLGNENIYGWYLSDGMTYIYNDHDPLQYTKYITRMNPYRVPGTTVDLLPREGYNAGMILFDHQSKAADIARAGGVMMDGRYSSAMMQLLGSRSDLMAKKSWFCFDNEVVCLGSDINLDADREVITTVENRQFTRTMYANGKKIASPVEKTIHDVSYAYIDSTGGYFFPSPVTLTANVGDNGYCEFWFSHGIAPKGASYAYVLLPEMSQKDVKSYSKKPQVEILSNTPQLQAVHHKTLGITALNFWNAGTYGMLSSDGVAAVMMRQDGDNLHLSISEPTWQRSSQVLTLDGQWNLTSSLPADNIVVLHDEMQTFIVLTTTYRMGMTQNILLNRTK